MILCASCIEDGSEDSAASIDARATSDYRSSRTRALSKASQNAIVRCQLSSEARLPKRLSTREFWLPRIARSWPTDPCCLTLSGAHGAVVALQQQFADESCQTLIKEAKRAGSPEPSVHGYKCDTSSEDAVKKTWDSIVKEFGKVDILVTNAGITGGALNEDYPYEDFKKTIDVNLIGPCFPPVPPESGGLTTKSTAAFSRLLDVRFDCQQTPEAIRHRSGRCMRYANALSPAYGQTEANEGEETEKLSKQWVNDIPMARVPKPEEFRGGAVWLVSDASSYVTGSEIIVDG
ncbi:NAD(P)-binding protein [Setomelanomma holmii]|uniref:NAD(P)-binding protein n=1 Tax=Setomelanomma holmii TaxID=210430 RepID=A0A9P4H7S7_9PLEO|nr:NAD(P)-binding protein [Setomelanomma holmii]